MPRLAPGRVVALHLCRDPEFPAKARWLGRASREGLPTPPGFVFGLGEAHLRQGTSSLDTAILELLRDGPLIARSALVGEDEDHNSAAGLGLSLGELHTLDATRDAVRAVAEARAEAALVAVRGAPHLDGDGVIVQRQIARETLVVGALLPSGVDYIETHGNRSDALAEGVTPEFSGLAQRWTAPSAAALQNCIAQIRARLWGPPLGLDVELIVAPDGSVHVVQVRPLTRDLEADGRTFLQAARAAGHAERLQGQLVLDAEHNPEPLSAAHASLIAWLARERPGSGHPTTVAGWLYVRTKVRDLGQASAAAMRPTEALEVMSTRWLPQARERLDALIDRLGALETADAVEAGLQLVGALDAACAAFLAMIDVYLKDLLPVRAAAGAALAARPDVPLSLDQRAGFVDVLPTRWDIAAPTLAQRREFSAPEVTANALPADPVEAAVLLTEWDDHLFALGLAPLRRVYLAAAAHLGWPPDLVFGLELDELRTALREPGDDHRARAQERVDACARWAQLRPPPRIDDGRPLPDLPRRRLRGVGLGPSYTGPLAQRANLDALLENPPGPDAIVVLPALTAQAALVLHELGIRAVCCDHGGALSHAALMVRELNLSGLIGARGSTELPDGAVATIDTTRGRIQIASSVTLGS